METLIDNSEVTLSAEAFDGDIYLHVGMKKWSPEVYKRNLIVFEKVKGLFKELGYDRLRSISPKGKESRLTNMFGMSPILETNEAYVNEVMI